MIYLKKYNESFSAEDYMDYLLSEVDESKILDKDILENLIYIEYDITIGESDRINNYLQRNERFNDVICKSNYDYDLRLFKLLIIDRSFYSRNQKWKIENINWVEHNLARELNKIDIPGLRSLYKDAKTAIGLPEGYSMIKNIKPEIIEFWEMEEMEEPIDIFEKDTTYFQYILFKYLAK